MWGIKRKNCNLTETTHLDYTHDNNYIFHEPELIEVLSGVGGDDVSLSTSSYSVFFPPKNFHISMAVGKGCAGGAVAPSSGEREIKKKICIKNILHSL